MAAQAVNGDQYRTIDRKLREIKRQLDQPEGYPFDLEGLEDHLQLAIEGKFARSEDVPLGFVTHEQAAQIMGDNFHGPGDVKKHFGIKLGRQKLFQSVPFSADILRTVTDTHVLVAASELSIMGIHGKVPQVFYSQHDPWYGENDQRRAFADAKIEPGWYLIRKNEVPGSTGERWHEQQSMLKAPDFVPEANLALYAWVLHFLATGERMFSRVWVRTNSVTAEGARVVLYGRGGGLDVNDWGGYAGSNIGVAGARKSS